MLEFVWVVVLDVVFDVEVEVVLAIVLLASATQTDEEAGLGGRAVSAAASSTCEGDTMSDITPSCG